MTIFPIRLSFYTEQLNHTLDAPGEIMNRIPLLALALLEAFSFTGCATVPPVYVYNRSYTDSGFRLSSRVGKNDNLKPYQMVVLIQPADDLIEKNNQRYVYGAFVNRLRDVVLFKEKTEDPNVRTPRIPAFAIRFSEKDVSGADYVARVTFTDYDFGFDASSVDKKESAKKTATRCFLVSAEIDNPTNKLDRYAFRSNGCPGMSDPRLVAKKIFGIMFADLWAVDSTKTYTLVLNGSAASSWYSDLETDKEVDALLGFKR